VLPKGKYVLEKAFIRNVDFVRQAQTSSTQGVVPRTKATTNGCIVVLSGFAILLQPHSRFSDADRDRSQILKQVAVRDWHPRNALDSVGGLRHRGDLAG
jgi:hypothetical protein